MQKSRDADVERRLKRGQGKCRRCCIMGRPPPPPSGWGWGEELGSESRGRACATEVRGTCTTVERARATEMDSKPTDFVAVDHGVDHQGQDGLSPHTKDRTELTEGNLRLFAAGSPPSAPPPRPAALALRLVSMVLERNDAGSYRIGYRKTALGDQWVIGLEAAGA